MCFFEACQFHGRTVCINILPCRKTMKDIVGARTNRVASLAIRLPLDVTPKQVPVRCIADRAGSAWFPAFGQTDGNDGLDWPRYRGKGEGYRVISLSRPCLANNYRRTTSREMFFPDSPPSLAKMYLLASPLKATWGENIRDCTFVMCWAL